MDKTKEKKIFLTVFVIILGLELINFLPSLIFLFAGFLSLFFLFMLSRILEIRIEDRSLYPIIVLPLVLLAEASIVLNIVPPVPVKHVFIILFGFLLYLVVSSLYAVKSHIVSYSVIIFNILTIAYLVSVLFAYVIINYFYLLFKLPVWFVMIFVGIITFSFFLFYLWKNNVLSKESYIYNFLLTILMVEFFWIVSFLPLLALSSGFILFLIYYIYSGLLTFSLKNSLDRKNLLSHAVIPSLVLLLFLLSSKW